jgi:predicted RNase H-like HicB family nuclease
MRQVLVYPGEDEFWVAECPSLPDCISQGKSKEEALNNIREAIEGYIAVLLEERLPVPPRKNLKQCSLPYEQPSSNFGTRMAQSAYEAWLCAKETTWQPYDSAL